MLVAESEGEFDRDVYDGKVTFDEDGVRSDHKKQVVEEGLQVA
jgi:hypothetical protein